MSYGVVLWAHNEADALAAAAAAWARPGCATAVVAVDDCSRDGSAGALGALAAELEPLSALSTAEVLGDWGAARAGVAALGGVEWVHLAPLASRPRPDAIAAALAAAGDAVAVLAPRDQRSPLGHVLARPGQEWGDAPWRAAGAALPARLAALTPLTELAHAAWIRREVLERAAGGPDRGPWTAEAWVLRALLAGEVAYWPQALCTLEARPERARDLAGQGAASAQGLAELLAELPPPWRAALEPWRGALAAEVRAQAERDREWVRAGLLELDAGSRRDRLTARALRLLLGDAFEA
ncbi:MAG: hypothetical protein R3F62_02005 [Planctomycetota bacterium]